MPSDRDRTAERDAVEALGRYWDGLADGRATAPDGSDPAYAATIDRLHGLDDAPGADPVFARRLAADLLGQAERAATLDLTPAYPAYVEGTTMDAQTPPRQLGPSASAVRVIPIVPNGHAADEAAPATLTAPPRPMRRGSNRWWPRLEYAAAVLLIVGLLGGALAGRGDLAGTGDPQQRSGAGTSPISLAAVASPRPTATTAGGVGATSLATVEPTACQVTPRTVEELEQLVSSVPTASSAPSPAAAATTTAPADAATVAGVTMTIGEFLGCLQAGNALGYLALFTDRGVLSGLEPPDAGFTWDPDFEQLATPMVNDEYRDSRLVATIADVQTLQDGRVQARVALGGDETSMTFLREGDRWLIDAADDLPPDGVSIEATTEATTAASPT